MNAPSKDCAFCKGADPKTLKVTTSPTTSRTMVYTCPWCDLGQPLSQDEWDRLQANKAKRMAMNNKSIDKTGEAR